MHRFRLPFGGRVAQLVEHLTFNQTVTGSNPVALTNLLKHLALFSALGVHLRQVLSRQGVHFPRSLSVLVPLFHSRMAA